MKKLINTLIFLIIIMAFISITLFQYLNEKSDIEKKIGALWTGGASISTYNYVAIINNFEYYKSYLNKKDYENAYNFLPYEYRRYKPYEEYLEDIKEINYEEFVVSSIIRRTENLYSILLLNENKEKLEHVIIFNKDNTSFTITPESFIEYNEYNKKIKKKKVQYELVSTINYIDKYVANIKLENLSKKDVVKISSIELVQNNVKHITGETNEIILNPGETKNITIEFETYIDFPNRIEISRYMEKNDKIETYIFELE